MHLIKKKLLQIKPDSIPSGWPEDNTEDKVLAVSASKRKYMDGWLFCATWFDRERMPFARVFMSKTGFIVYYYRSESWGRMAIDRILLPGTRWGHLSSRDEIYVEEKIWKVIKSCGIKNQYAKRPLDAITEEQYRIKNLKSITASKAVTKRINEAEQYDIESMQPEPPEDMINVLFENELLNTNYLLYRGRTQRATKTTPREVYYTCHCSDCGGEYTVTDDIYCETPTHNSNGWCQMCGKMGTFVDLARLRNPWIDKVSILVFNRIESTILAIAYTVERKIYKSGLDCIEITDEDAFLFTQNRAIRYAKWWCGFMGKEKG